MSKKKKGRRFQHLDLLYRDLTGLADGIRHVRQKTHHHHGPHGAYYSYHRTSYLHVHKPYSGRSSAYLSQASTTTSYLSYYRY